MVQTKIVSQTSGHTCTWNLPPLTEGLHVGNIQCTHVGGRLDVTDLMSHFNLGNPPLKVSRGNLAQKQGIYGRKQETGGLRTAVASALLLVVVVARNSSQDQPHFCPLLNTFPAAVMLLPEGVNGPNARKRDSARLHLAPGIQLPVHSTLYHVTVI